MLAAVGSVLFVAYGFFTFFVIFGYFMVIMWKGIQANNTDYQIKELLVLLGKDSIEIKQLCDNGKVWAKKIEG